MMSLQEECDKIQQAVWNNDVSTIQQLLDNNIDVINADVFSDKWRVSDVLHNVCHKMILVDDIINVSLITERH